MALNVGTLYAELKIEDGQFNSKLGQAEAQLKRVDQTAGKAGGAVRDMGAAGGTAGQQINTGMGQAERGAGTLTAALGKAKTVAAGLGLVLGARQAVGFFTDAINSAREAEAYTLRVRNTFEDAEGAVTEWAQTTAHGLRMSEDAAKNAALSFSTFGIVLGESGNDLADYSTGLAELAADLAAYGDYDLATVVNDMTSALSGQAVPMRKYGVLLDEATLRQIAFENGITESNRELTQSEKLLAITAGLYQELDYAVGASEMSAGTFGDSMRELRVNFENVRSEIGQKFLPIANTFVQLLSGPGLSALSAFGDVLGVVGTALETVSGVFLGLPGPIQVAIAAIVGARLASMALGTEIGTKLVAKLAVGKAAMSNMALEGAAWLVVGMNALRDSFVKAGGGAAGFGAALKTAASGGVAALETGVGKVVNLLGGPYMLALGLAAGAIGHWISEQRRARERVDELEASAKELAKSVIDSGVAIDGVNPKLSDMAKNAADAAVENIKLANTGSDLSKAFDQIGLSTDKAALGLAGNKKAAEETIEILEQLAAGEYRNSDGALVAIEKDDAEQALSEYRLMYEVTRAELEKTAEAAERTKEALTEFDIDIDDAGIAAITDAMEEFADTTKSAVDRIGALTKALDQIWADKFTEEAAFAAYGEALDSLVGSLEGLDDAALNADGSLNMMDKSARDLFGDIESYASSMSQMAATMLLSGESMDDVSDALGEQRQAFIDAGVAAGHTEEQMIALADRYGLIPDDITLNIQSAGIEPAMSALDTLDGKIEGIQDGKIITTEVLSDEAIADLEALGLKVDETPDGKQMYITADGKEAELVFELMKAYVNSDNEKNMTVNVDGHEFAKTTLDTLIELVNTDNEKDIVVDSNAEDVISLLEALNITTTTLDDGTVVITDNAADVSAKIDRLLNGKQTQGTHTVTINQRVGNAVGSAAQQAFPGYAASRNADGSIRTRAQGALDTAQIRNGSGDGIVQHTGFGPVQWAEGETGWEAFIPGAASKRQRSTQILVETARRMGYGVIPLDAIRMADGGVRATSIDEFASGIEGAQYTWGGSGSWNTDCSGGVSRVVNYAVGRDPDEARTSTATMGAFLAERGFLPGPGGSGDLTVGWYNGGPYGGHTSLTLPSGVNVEMGGARGDGQYGGTAASAFDPMYTDHMHLPGDQVMGAYGDMDGGIEGGGSYGSGAGGGLGGSSRDTGGGSGGHGTPVMVTNWPSSIGRSGGGDMTVNTSHVLADMPPIAEVIEEAEESEQYRPEIDLSRVPAAGRDSILGDLGLSGDGFLSQLVKQAPEIDRLIREQAEKDVEAGVTIENHYHVQVADQESFHRRAEDDLRRNIAQFGGNS